MRLVCHIALLPAETNVGDTITTLCGKQKKRVLQSDTALIGCTPCTRESVRLLNEMSADIRTADTRITRARNALG